MKRITIQGIAGCFHETAARCSFPGEQVEILPCDSFDQQFARMAADPTLLGIAAIENTIAGSLLPNHELLRRSSLAVIGEYKLRISHVLAALPGEAPCDIGEVHSHPIALMQCGDYLKAHPAMKVVERDDTAAAPRNRQPAARRHGGHLRRRSSRTLRTRNPRRGIETNNTTSPFLLADAAARTGSPIRPHRQSVFGIHAAPRRGASQECSPLSFYGINLTKIQSLPIIGREWEYRFT
ncbi:MAG: prephenate dehydratase [Alistipes finegoldii]